MEQTDAELVRAVLAGDKDAFPALLARHMDGVYRFAYRYLRHGEDAEDVTQETFVRAWRNLKRFDTTKNFKTWIFTIAKNAALDLIKKKKPLLFSQINEDDDQLDVLLAPYVGAQELPDTILQRKMVAADIERALGALPPGYRMVLAMRYRDHLKFREIAETLGEPIDTVKSKHRRGIILLRRVILGDATGSSFA
ncbi:MAG: sigma-70 family RNA polymerase sigma factor [Minisyncoccia bacterium]|jgi:RNA polymerase sigma-70 factor (ECF subfamily)